MSLKNRQLFATLHIYIYNVAFIDNIATSLSTSDDSIFMHLSNCELINGSLFCALLQFISSAKCIMCQWLTTAVVGHCGDSVSHPSLVNILTRR